MMIVVPPSIPEDTEMVSLGDEDPYQNMTIEEEVLYFLDDKYDDNPGRDADYTKYGDGLLTNLLAKLHKSHSGFGNRNANHISSSSNHYSSIINAVKCNMTVFMVNNVIKVSNSSKKCFIDEKSDELWLIDSRASHHITNELSDYTSYKPYETPDPIQTANVHDSLMIHSEGTVFFDTKTTNGQIHKVCLNNVCYIPNGSNRLISRGQLCKSGSVEKADNKSTTFLLPTGHMYLSKGIP